LVDVLQKKGAFKRLPWVNDVAIKGEYNLI